ncbi:hypothetical protein B5S31_g1364 [[Candida] boidinii]|nr:hypothetical protein B5S29_g347 [[Candida] boidinii]OWB71673.1 hypothetical protein B5S31_g1364 [[Candida] boidinii]OWB76402.1 hypothetical protein B5S32_g553 [[Candida] boidinii]
MQLCYDQIKYFSKSKNKTTKFNSEKMVLIVFSIFMISLIFLTFKKWNSLSNTSFSYFFERFKSFISYFTSAAKEKSISRGFFTAPNALKQNEMHSETENNEVMELHEEIADFLNDSFENLENGNNDDDNDSKSADECELPIILSENTAPFSSSVSASTNNSSNSSKKSDNFDLSTVEGIEKWKNFIKHKVKLRIQDGVIGSDTGKSDNPVLEDSQSPLSPKESFNSGSSQLIYPPIHLPLRWITPAQLQHKTNMENIQFYDKNGKKFRRIFLPERGWISSRKLEQEIRSGESATFGPLYGMATNSI